ncbi:MULTISPECIES: hypothetical protein [Sphingobacterium]|uniref:hypothetical protein n=1 Tax=Sphingobacterium TaxID=28453 RepID=UPI00257F7E06|nr:MULTISPECIES: hypothetical protein [Sphingobacterium]
MIVKFTKPLTEEEVLKIQKFIADNRSEFNDLYPEFTEEDESSVVFNLLDTASDQINGTSYRINLGLGSDNYPTILRSFITNELGYRFL